MHRILTTLGCGVAILAVEGMQARQSQTAGQAPIFRSGTSLVQLDVVVTGRDGKPVAGLTKEDFTVLDAGRERPVVAMNEFHHEAPRAANLNSDVATGATERLVAVVLDDHSQTGEPLERASAHDGSAVASEEIGIEVRSS